MHPVFLLKKLINGGLMLNLVFDSVLLGVGLAMDAFSVSIVNGLNEPNMRRKKSVGIAGTFAFFQFIMPVIGWTCVHTIARAFKEFQKCIPWIALILLLYIGGKMLIEGIKDMLSNNVSVDNCEGANKFVCLGKMALLVQGIATSIDALSVGFTISSYNTLEALLASLIIAVVTFAICIVGLIFGKKFGEKLSDKATILGGLILIFIGLKVFISGI